jgi:uncharacterized protein (TIGR03437 family)
MFKHLLPIVSLVTIAGVSLLAQPPDSLVASGYLLPTGATVAPGQVLRLFVQGVGTTLTGPVFAASVPLPTTLADISISVAGLPVPIFAVAPVSSCAGTVFAPDLDLPGQQPHNCGSFVAITVQVPFEMPATPTGAPSNAAVSVDFIISEGGVAKVAVAMNTLTDQIHVITACDLSAGIGLATSVATLANPPCPGLAFHSDGTPAVNSQGFVRPAQPGEQLVMYALGLGPTTPPAQTGQPSPPGATTPFIQIGFDFSLSALPKRPPYQTQQPNLVFAGLAPGSVGLYQINFIVPQPPAGTPSCPSDSGVSNLTVSIGILSFDGAGLCVAVK